jgi:hypothetical protein
MPFSLGFWATAGAGGAAAGSYELISTAYGTGSSGTITFSSIPQDYKHLQIRGTVRGTNAASFDGFRIYANGISTDTYAVHILQGNGSSVASQGYTASANDLVWYGAGGNMATGVYSPFVVDLLDYTSTNKNKTFRAISGVNGAGLGSYITMNSSLFLSTNAITSMTIRSSNNANYASATRMSLYGIKG